MTDQTINPLPALATKISAAILPDKSLTVNGTLLGDSQIGTALSASFENGDIQLSAASVLLSDAGQAIAINGTVTYEKMTGAAATLTITSDANSNLVLVAEFTLSGVTKFGDIYQAITASLIADLTISDAVIVFNSSATPCRQQTLQVLLAQGLNIASRLSLDAAGPLGSLAGLFAGAATLPLSGPVTDSTVPYFSLATTPVSATVGALTINDLCLVFDIENLTSIGGNPVFVSRAGVQGTLAVATGSGRFSATLTDSSSLVDFSAAISGVTLNDFSALSPFIGAATPLTALPDPIQTRLKSMAAAFQIAQVGFSVDLADKSVKKATVTVGIDLQGFAIYDIIPALKINAVDFTFAIDRTQSSGVTFQAVADIDAGGFDVALRFETQPGGAYIISAEQKAGTTLKLTQVLSSFVPGLSGFPDFDVSGFGVTIEPANKYYAFQAVIESDWDIITSPRLTLTEIDLAAAWMDKETSGLFNGTLALTVDASKPDTTILLHAGIEKDGDAWQVTAGTTPDQIIPIGSLIAALENTFSTSTEVPAVIADMTIENLNASFRSASGSSASFSFHCGINDTLCGTTVALQVSIETSRSGTAYSNRFSVSVLVGSALFTGELDISNSEKIISLSWQAQNNACLQFADIAATFGLTVPAIPDELDLALKSGSLTYDFTKEELVLTLQSENYGSAVFVAVKNGTTQAWQFFFGLAIGKPVPISNLPLLSDLIPPEDTVEVRDIAVLIASAPFNDAMATDVNALIAKAGPDYPLLPDTDQKGMGQGFGLSMVFAIGSDTIPLALGTAAQQQLQETLSHPNDTPVRRADLPVPYARVARRSLAAPVAAAASSDATVWFTLQKSFGPVAIDKIGIQYQSGKLGVLSNMSLAGGGLTLGLIDLGIESPLTTFDPVFTLSGIDVSWSGGGVNISGGLVGTIDPVNFIGELMVDAEGFGIAGLAAYASVEDQPSMFLYAVLDMPLGGPPCFFVTGLAAGFGYNRDLQIPDVGGIASFPLVEWAQGKGNVPPMDPTSNIGEQVAAVLSQLENSGIVAPKPGEYWLTAGIRFTSFELLNSLALAVIKFGDEVEVDILGTSILAIPPDVPAIYAELELLGSLKPAEGFVGISGQLTPRSWVLAEACHLTGGFAFNFWYSGPYAGNVIATLGGYNPHFAAPSYYPVVPRLGINWQVTGDLVIKGDAYFALTSAAVMAGGGWSATWQGGPISAWFNIQADFLMSYRPFHYYIDASITIGASFRISLIFTHITLTIHVGAEAEIWGPDFAGKARVDLDIVSFTINFGDSNQNTQTRIAWSEFVSQMLPGVSSGQPSQSLVAMPAHMQAAADSAAASPKVNVAKGMIKQLSDNPATLDFVVNPETLALTITVSIPVKESSATFGGLVMLAPASLQPQDANGQEIKPNDDFGVGPAGIDHADFTPTLTISITPVQVKEDADSDTPTLQAVRILQNAPNSLWKKIGFDSHGVPQAGDPLNDTSIPNVIVGYTLIPVPQTPDHTLPINIQYLLYTLGPKIQPFSWSTAFVPDADSFTGEAVEETIAATTAVNNRSALLPVLQGFFPTLTTSPDVDSLTSTSTSGLLHEPVLSLIGEEKSAA